MNGVPSSWYEATARQRISNLLDADTFEEFVGPAERRTSVHLSIFDLPVQFDDGVVVGSGMIEGRRVLVAAQEGRFMGGAIGEVHGAKIAGLIRGAAELRVPVLLALDTGGVRLQEANAGEIAIAEIMRAVVCARSGGIQVLALIGGRAGCFGGGSLIASTCSAIVMSEFGRLSVTGPEVIETNRGIEEFDSRDRPLVWRTTGGKHRYLTGGADRFVDDSIPAFRGAAASLLNELGGFDLERLQFEHDRLQRRLSRHGNATDATAIWASHGIDRPAEIPDLPTDKFLKVADAIRSSADEAR